MALTDALRVATAAIEALNDALGQVGDQPIRIDVAPAEPSSEDRVVADAIRRAQRPETVGALRRALGL